MLAFDNPPPRLIIPYRFFCFTGHFLKVKRRDCENLVSSRGGIVKSHLNRVVSYLVIGTGLYEYMKGDRLNNKMSDAVLMRSEGLPISVISEDFFAERMNEAPKKLQNSSFIVNSSTHSEKSYEVNLIDLTCTCPNFTAHRSEYSVGDPRRLCKHLVKTLTEQEYVPELLLPYAEKIAISAIYDGGTVGWGSNGYVNPNQ